jgi:hypothetical protein
VLHLDVEVRLLDAQLRRALQGGAAEGVQLSTRDFNSDIAGDRPSSGEGRGFRRGGVGWEFGAGECAGENKMMQESISVNNRPLR